MTWRMLDAASPEDTAHWLGLWNEWPTREVSAHPSYLALFAEPGERVLCATWTSADCTILFPFILRRIGNEPWAEGLQGWDLESPYGYGGPFTWGSKPSGAEAFWQAFDQWSSEVGLVSAFARLSLFSADIAPILLGEVAVAQMNVVRDLLLDDETLLRDYEHKVRKNVKRATEGGIVVEFDKDGTRLDEFLSVYTATMDRRSAAGRYYFDRSFFERLCGTLPGQYVFAHAMDDSQVVSTELVLLSATHAYSFLGGTLSDSFHLRPNDLLKHEVARWARDHGRLAYVLGGGYGGQDGIYRYKRSFAPKGEHEFRVWRYAADPVALEEAVKTRRDRAHLLGIPWDPKQGFFPPYRG